MIKAMAYEWHLNQIMSIFFENASVTKNWMYLIHLLYGYNCSTFFACYLYLYLGSIVTGELYYVVTLLQRNYRKMTIS